MQETLTSEQHLELSETTPFLLDWAGRSLPRGVKDVNFVASRPPGCLRWRPPSDRTERPLKIGSPRSDSRLGMERRACANQIAQGLPMIGELAKPGAYPA